MSKILITGASGFIGKTLCKSLSISNRFVRGAVRSMNFNLANTDVEYVSVGDINAKTNWKDFLVGIDYVIHCAGRVHIMNETKKNALKIYRSINVNATKQLAEQSAAAGVKKLIYLSSIKVNGENTHNNSNLRDINNKNKYIFKHNDNSNPGDPYSISKFEAEEVLWELSSKTGLEVTVLRLPLVYGHGVKGNLARLIKLIKSNIPLPLSLVKNHRSMIGIDNLVDLLIRCIDHPDASGKTFLVSDGDDLSTPDFIKQIANSIGCKALLFPVPIFLLKFLGRILGKEKEINRLVGSLKIDSSYVQKVLNWTPPVSVEEGIRRMTHNK